MSIEPVAPQEAVVLQKHLLLSTPEVYAAARLVASKDDCRRWEALHGVTENQQDTLFVLLATGNWRQLIHTMKMPPNIAWQKHGKIKVWDTEELIWKLK